MRPDPLCYTCGYNLRGNLGDAACPECGRAIEWRPSWRRDGRHHWRNVALVACATILLFCVIFHGSIWIDSILLGAGVSPHFIVSPWWQRTMFAFVVTGFIGQMATLYAACWLVLRRTRAFESSLMRVFALFGVLLSWWLLCNLLAAAVSDALQAWASSQNP